MGHPALRIHILLKPENLLLQYPLLFFHLPEKSPRAIKRIFRYSDICRIDRNRLRTSFTDLSKSILARYDGISPVKIVYTHSTTILNFSPYICDDGYWRIVRHFANNRIVIGKWLHKGKPLNRDESDTIIGRQCFSKFW